MQFSVVKAKCARWREFYSSRVDGRQVEATIRNRIAISLFRLSLEHSAGILVLCEQGLVRTAMSLLRLQLEAYVRAEWFHFRANENDIARFLKHSEPPKFGEMISALEEHPPFDGNHLSRSKVDFWRIFNDFTHGGTLQVDAMADGTASEALLSESIIGEAL